MSMINTTNWSNREDSGVASVILGNVDFRKIWLYKPARDLYRSSIDVFYKYFTDELHEVVKTFQRIVYLKHICGHKTAEYIYKR